MNRILPVGLTVLAPLFVATTYGKQAPDQIAGLWVKAQAETDRKRYFTELGSTRKEALDLVRDFRASYRSNPTRLNLISWALADIHYGQRHDLYRGMGDSTLELSKALEEQRFPVSVELARVVFLIGARQHASLSWEKAGQRLLQLDPNDVPVLYRMCSLLDDRRTEASFVQAIAYADRLIRLRPRESSSYVVKAAAYFWRNERSHDSKDREQALKYYDLTLKYLPSSQEEYKRQLGNFVSSLRRAGSASQQ